MRRRAKILCALPAALSGLLLSGLVPLQAQQIPAAPLPTDPAVTMGELENGLKFYIRRNSRPENRAELRLVLNAGSILEDDSQRGLAHLVEHMAFNGTANFEKQELVNYLESIGMAFGPSINAYTSFDETVYMLQLPTDDDEAFTTGFQILEDWAHQVSFEPGEIDAERGVVVEEWRLGRGAAARISDQQIPVILADSRYAERLPIGQVEVLQTFAHEELTRFYEEWYRPDLMAVVAVGDFDVARVEALIRDHFERIPTPETPLDRPTFTVPDHEETFYSIATDPELPSSQVALLTTRDPEPTETLVDYRRLLVEQLAGQMLNQRFQERAQAEDPPFLGAGSGRGALVRAKRIFQLVAAVQPNGHARAFRALLEEAERAARFGFTEGELDRAKLNLLESLERQYAERENQPSARYASEYVTHFLQGVPMPGIEFEYQAGQALLQTIFLEDVNSLARSDLQPGNRVVIATGPDREGVTVPTAEAFGEVLAAVAELELEPYEDTATDQPLLPGLPAPGSIVAERELPVVGVTEWELSNGAVVWVKPTDFKDDEIVLRATSPGGWSRASLEEHTNATNATVVVGQGGVGAFSRIDLQKALAGKSASVGMGIGETEETVTGSTRPADLETFFQLLYLNFTAPREDSVAFAALQGQLRAFLENRGASPMAAFQDTLNATLFQNHPRMQPPSVAMMDELDLGGAVEFYRERFADASDFHFTIVGAVDLETLRPLVEQYVASLPTVERDDGWIDLDMDPPAGRIEKVVRKGLEPQSQTQIVFTGPFDYTAENRVRMRALTSVLEVRLRERLREDMGGTYGVGVNGGYDDIPEERFTFRIQFGADPERAEELKAAVFEEIERLQAEGPTELDIQKAVEGLRRSLETNLEQNPWWAAQLSFAAAGDVDPSFLLDEGRYDAVTAPAIQEDATRYLGTENIIIVTLLPEVPVG